jgi:hypothetical protein
MIITKNSDPISTIDANRNKIPKEIILLIIGLVVIASVLGFALLRSHSQQNNTLPNGSYTYSTTMDFVAGGSSSAGQSNNSNVTEQTTLANYIYCVGSANQSQLNLSYYAPITSKGIGNWIPTANYPTELFLDGCPTSNNYIYCVGSPDVNNGSNYSYFAPISDSGIGPWTKTSSYPTTLVWDGCSIANNYIYCVGDGNYSSPTHTFYAPVSSSGIGTWKLTTSYPNGLFDAGCSIYNGYIYCVGTEYAPAVNTTSSSPSLNSSINITGLYNAYYAPVSSSGIGAWQLTTHYPIPIFAAGCSIYNSTIYCVGDGYPDQSLQNSVYFAPILTSGGIGAWKSTTSYPVPFLDSGCVTAKGYIYCLGTLNSTIVGSNPLSNSTNSTNSSTITYSQLTYFAPISKSGVGKWNETTEYPLPLFDSYCSTTGESGGFYSG